MPRTTSIVRQASSPQEEIRNEVDRPPGPRPQAPGSSRRASTPSHNPLELHPREPSRPSTRTKHKNGAIRRLNANIAATTVETLPPASTAAEIGTYQLCPGDLPPRPAYEELHPKGPKSDYACHTEAHDRAMAAGIDDVGLGVLFGLGALPPTTSPACSCTPEHLGSRAAASVRTPSPCRACSPADDIDPGAPSTTPCPTTSSSKIVALIRIAVPYTGHDHLHPRRRSAVRAPKRLKLGVSADLRRHPHVSVGGYAHPLPSTTPSRRPTCPNTTTPSLDEVIGWLMDEGHLPPVLLHGLLPRRPHRRPLHGMGQGRQHRHVLPGQRHHDDEGVHVRLRLEGNPRGRRARHRQRTPEDPAREDPHRQRSAPDPHRRRRTRTSASDLQAHRPSDQFAGTPTEAPRPNTGGKRPADHIGSAGPFCFWGFFSFLFRGTARSDRGPATAVINGGSSPCCRSPRRSAPCRLC